MISLISSSFEIVIYGLLTSMVMKNCPFSSLKGCKNDRGCKTCKYSKEYYLKDENKEYFLVNRLDGYSELYNSKILNGYDILNEIDFSKGGNIRLVLKQEDEKLTKIFNEKISKNKNGKVEFNKNTHTKGHFNRGID